MTTKQIEAKLTAAGCEVKTIANRVYVSKTPNGKTDRYGYLESGDDGSTGSCRNVTKRRGEIAAILRGE